jgi:hypothetical protein
MAEQLSRQDTADEVDFYDDANHVSEPVDPAEYAAYDAALQRHEDVYYRGYDEELARVDQELACAIAEVAAASASSRGEASEGAERSVTHNAGDGHADAACDAEVDELG